MLNKKNRLKNKVAYYATYKQNQSVSDGLFVLYVGKIKEEGEDTKFGFVVSKKVHKRAVKRNYIKRRAREVIRLILKDGYEFKVKSIIILARIGAVDKSYRQIEESIKELIKKAEVFC